MVFSEDNTDVIAVWNNVGYRRRNWVLIRGRTKMD